ncbi:MAG: hypothetical protein ACOZNI_09685 [Myxococcota bacterium]
MRETLSIRTDLEHLATIEWCEGSLVVHAVHPEYETAVERWRLQGLLEWLPEGEAVVPRHTPSSDRLFLGRLEAYLRTHYPGHHTVLQATPTTPVKSTEARGIELGDLLPMAAAAVLTFSLVGGGAGTLELARPGQAFSPTPTGQVRP